MLNPVAPVQMPEQVQSPMKGHDGQNHSSKSESKKFDTILAREIAEKEPAPVENHAKKTTPDTRRGSAESASDASAPTTPSVPSKKAGDTGKTGIAQAADAARAASATDTLTTMANPNNELAVNQTPAFQISASQVPVSQTPISQILFPENGVNAENTLGIEGVEGMPPVVSLEVPAGNVVPPHHMQAGVNEKRADVMLNSGLAIAPASVTAATPTPTQPLQFGLQESLMRSPAGNGTNSQWRAQQNPHFADDSASPMLSSGFQRHLPERMAGANQLWQTDRDMLQFHNQPGLSGGVPAGETVFPLQTGTDMPHIHSQSGLSSVTQTVSNTAAQTVAAHHIGLDAQMGQPQWGDEFAQKIVWLTHQQNQIAELRLNPAHLGPVEILLNLAGDNGQASAQFVSPHLAVREAIEAALPRLREMMAESGIQLGDVMVGAESFQRQEQGERGHQQARPMQSVNAHDESSLSLEKQFIPNPHNGIVNTFA